VLPVVISFKNQDISAKNLGFEDLKKLTEEIESTCGVNVIIKRGAEGDLFVFPEEEHQRELLLQLQNIGNQAIECRKTRQETSAKGIIHRVPTIESEENLFKLLHPQGVAEVKRMTMWRNEEAIPTDRVILTFNGPIPKVIYLPEGPHSVDIFIPRPKICKNCWRYGHIQTRCIHPSRCRKCGGNHSSEEKCPTQMRCLACKKGGHWIGNNVCETQIKRQRALFISTKEKIPFHEALGIANNETEYNDQAESNKVNEIIAEIKQMKDRMATMERSQKVCTTSSAALGERMTKLEHQQQEVPKIAAAVEGIQQELNVIRGNMDEIKEVNSKCKSMEASIGSLATKLDVILNKLGSNELKNLTPMGPVVGRGRVP
jgi:hypothetical protein